MVQILFRMSWFHVSESEKTALTSAWLKIFGVFGCSDFYTRRLSGCVDNFQPTPEVGRNA